MARTRCTQSGKGDSERKETYGREKRDLLAREKRPIGDEKRPIGTFGDEKRPIGDVH